jgi:hypothetical protein
VRAKTRRALFTFTVVPPTAFRPSPRG